jgi:DNA recombination protein RmuC
MTALIALLLVLVGLAAGFAGGLLVSQGRGMSAASQAERDQRVLELADSRFREASAGARGELDSRRQAVEHLVGPLHEALTRVEGQLRELEQARLTAYTALTEQVGFARETSEQLRSQTAALATALRAPQSRGRWGEMHLRRVVEVSGMVEHCDFDTQVTAVTRDGRPVRPDLVVRLAGGKSVVVDAKVPLTAYLDAAETDSASEREALVAHHAKALRAHVDALAGKEYWTAFEPCPELVVLFVPGEAFLAPALEADPRLLDDAMRKGVVVATPTTLLTLLRTVAYAWQQEALTTNAKEVFEVGRELYKRLCTLGGAVDKLGGSLRRAVEHYNGAVGTLERGVLVQARRMSVLGLTDLDLPSPQTLEESVRPLAAQELLDGVA